MPRFFAARPISGVDAGFLKQNLLGNPSPGAFLKAPGGGGLIFPLLGTLWKIHQDEVAFHE